MNDRPPMFESVGDLLRRLAIPVVGGLVCWGVLFYLIIRVVR